MSFANSSNFTIQGSTFTDVNGNYINYTSQPGEKGIRELFRCSCPEAAYDSQNYHLHAEGSSGTHELAVKEVLDWISGGRTKICWIYGAPSTGKSSVMQDVAAQCAHKGILGASFFFNRDLLTSSELLISSIAFQLAIANSEKRLHFGEIIEADPSILQKPLSIQMKKLVVTPLLPKPNEDNETLHPNHTIPPIVVMINAIDECFGEGPQREIIHLVQEAASHEHLPILWIIASRPESNIRRSFNMATTQVHSISIADIDRLLETQRRPTIFTYFRNRFNESYERQPTVTGYIQSICIALFNLGSSIFWRVAGLLFVIFSFAIFLRLLLEFIL